MDPQYHSPNPLLYPPITTPILNSIPIPNLNPLIIALLPRGLYSPPPPGPEPPLANHPTLLFSWFCTIGSLAIILARVAGRLGRTGRLFREDVVMVLAIIPLMVRMGLIHVVLLWGTNNVDLSVGLEEDDIRRRVVGSRIVLGARIFYALFIWTAKFTVSEFLKRLTYSFWNANHQKLLHLIRIFLVVSFTAVVIATLSECRPISHYWQVVPDPGPACRESYAQLFTMALADIITDVLLIVFPLTIILPSHMAPIRRARLAVLFSISAVLIIITAWRVASVVRNNGTQQRRTVYASGEIIAAAAVSNAVILGGFLRGRGVKKAKYHSQEHRNSSSAAAGGTGVGTADSSRRATLTRFAGSDEDLFRDMCYRASSRRSYEGGGSLDDEGVDPYDTSADVYPILPARPAPVGRTAKQHEEHHQQQKQEGMYRMDSRASGAPMGRRPSRIPSLSSLRQHARLARKRSSSLSAATAVMGGRSGSGSGSGAVQGRMPKTVTFCDAGGLLDGEEAVGTSESEVDEKTRGRKASKDVEAGSGPSATAGVEKGREKDDDIAPVRRSRTASLAVLPDLRGLLL